MKCEKLCQKAKIIEGFTITKEPWASFETGTASSTCVVAEAIKNLKNQPAGERWKQQCLACQGGPQMVTVVKK